MKFLLHLLGCVRWSSSRTCMFCLALYFMSVDGGERREPARQPRARLRGSAFRIDRLARILVQYRAACPSVRISIIVGLRSWSFSPALTTLTTLEMVPYKSQWRQLLLAIVDRESLSTWRDSAAGNLGNGRAGTDSKLVKKLCSLRAPILIADGCRARHHWKNYLMSACHAHNFPLIIPASLANDSDRQAQSATRPCSPHAQSPGDAHSTCIS